MRVVKEKGDATRKKVEERIEEEKGSITREKEVRRGGIRVVLALGRAALPCRRG